MYSYERSALFQEEEILLTLFELSEEVLKYYILSKYILLPYFHSRIEEIHCREKNKIHESLAFNKSRITRIQELFVSRYFIFSGVPAKRRLLQ
jgi:hypothetical protein